MFSCIFLETHVSLCVLFYLKNRFHVASKNTSFSDLIQDEAKVKMQIVLYIFLCTPDPNLVADQYLSFFSGKRIETNAGFSSLVVRIIPYEMADISIYRVIKCMSLAE